MLEFKYARLRGVPSIVNSFISRNLAVVNSQKRFARDHTTRVNDYLLAIPLRRDHAYASAVWAGDSGYRRLAGP